jgi:hypothetical protein
MRGEVAVAEEGITATAVETAVGVPDCDLMLLQARVSIRMRNNIPAELRILELSRIDAQVSEDRPQGAGR